MTNAPEILCIYHSPCNDGFTAAWIVHNYHKEIGLEIELFPTGYNREPPLELCKGKKVYIVDFSYPAFQLQQIADVAESVVLIDHHKTALPLLDFTMEGTSFTGDIELTIDMNFSGAMLTWRHFYGDEKPPQIVEYVQDRDMWWKKLYGCDEVHYALRSYEPDVNIWDNMKYNMEHPGDFERLVNEGVAIQRYNKSWMQAHLLESTREIIVASYLVPSINIPGIFSSDACNILAKNRLFAVAWYESKNVIKYSLRSSADYPNHVDVSEIAKKFGGGGHKHAAGFELPFTHRHTLAAG